MSPHHPDSDAGWPDALAWRPPARPADRLIDTHLLAALLAAAPVWLALAQWAGPWMRAPLGLWAWVSFVLLMPLIEELVLRGLLQGRLLRLTTVAGQPRRIGPITWANALTTFAFVALHLLAQPPLWALAVAVPSLLLGHLRDRLHSVWPAIGVHAVYNAGFALTAWWTQA